MIPPQMSTVPRWRDHAWVLKTHLSYSAFYPHHLVGNLAQNKALKRHPLNTSETSLPSSQPVCLSHSFCASRHSQPWAHSLHRTDHSLYLYITDPIFELQMSDQKEVMFFSLFISAISTLKLTYLWFCICILKEWNKRVDIFLCLYHLVFWSRMMSYIAW